MLEICKTKLSAHEMEVQPGDCMAWERAAGMGEENQHLNDAAKHKEAGNSLFEAKLYQEAACEYLAGLKMIENLGDSLATDKEARKYVFRVASGRCRAM